MTPAQERTMRALAAVCDEFKSFDPGMPLGKLEAFVLVALHEGKSLKELCEISGQPQSTLSRHLLDLGERNRTMGPGLRLVEWRIDPYELRRKQYLLTPEGRELLGRLLEILEPAEGQRGRRSGPSEGEGLI